MSIWKVNVDNLDKLFVVWAFLLQIALIVHFAVRKHLFESYTVKFGWIVYALSTPAVYQYYSVAGWKKLVVLVGRLPLYPVCCIWLLGRLCAVNSMAKPAPSENNVSLRVSISGHGHVLLVAGWDTEPSIVDRIRHIVYHGNNLKRYISLDNCLPATLRERTVKR